MAGNLETQACNCKSAPEQNCDEPAKELISKKNLLRSTNGFIPLRTVGIIIYFN